MKKPLLIVGGILLLVLLGVIIYFGFIQQSAIQPISDASEEALVSGINFVTVVDGISLTGERKLICGGVPPYPFSISNGYSDENPSHPRRAPNNNPLILWADKGDGGDCINYINVQGTFPKGILEVTCNLKSYSSDTKPAYAYCSVNSITKLASASQSTPDGGEVKQEIITVNTDNTNVKIESKVDVSPLSYSLSEVTIKFIPFTQIVTKEDVEKVQVELINQNLQDTTTDEILNNNTLVSKISQNTGFTEEKVKFILKETEESNMMLFVIGSVVLLIILLIIGIILMRKK